MGQFASNLGNTNVTDPRQAKWGDLDASEKGARVFAGGLSGLGQGLQNTNFNPQQPNQPISQFQSGYPTQDPFSIQQSRGIRNPYFFGYGGQ